MLNFAPTNQGRNLERVLPKLGCDTDGFVLKPKMPLVFGNVGCDMPSQGGIGGNIGKKPKGSIVCYMA